MIISYSKFINCIDFWDRVSEFWVDDDDLDRVIYHITLDGYDYSINYDGKKLTVEGDRPKNLCQSANHIRLFFDIAYEMNVEPDWVGCEIINK